MPHRFDPVHMGSPRFRSLEHRAFVVTEAWFPPGLGLPPHEHERPVIAVTCAGTWSSLMWRHPCACASGTLLVEPAGERHSNRFGPMGGHVVVVQPDLARAVESDAIAAALGEPTVFTAPAAVPIASRLRQELAAPDGLTPLAVDALCIELLVAAARSASPPDRQPPRWLRVVLEYLHAHAREPLTLEQVAAVAGVHTGHLAREFRAHFRTSVASYVRQLRLAWAEERLAASCEPLAGIALDAGFADQSHFTRAFRRYSGLTPQAYRRRATA